jgi:monofunctional biosynthetic peptidoglycan transglycosylase
MPDRLLFDFNDPSAADGWRSVDDVVMGGVSDSHLEARADSTTAFTGTVSLDRGGGFCSVRAPEGDYDLSGCAAIQLRVRGDDQRYKFTLYTRAAGRISYRFAFRAPDEWTTVTVPFNELTPFRRGRRVPDAPPFDPSDIRTMGFLIGDKQAGPFTLEIDWIKGVADA